MGKRVVLFEEVVVVKWQQAVCLLLEVGALSDELFGVVREEVFHFIRPPSAERHVLLCCSATRTPQNYPGLRRNIKPTPPLASTHKYVT